jgi:hypothetical protein
MALMQGEMVRSKTSPPLDLFNRANRFKHGTMEVLVAKTAGRDRCNVKTRPVRCITTGAVYASSRDAADILAMQGIMLTPESIALACQGRQKSAGGLVWEYAGHSRIASSAAKAI